MQVLFDKSILLTNYLNRLAKKDFSNIRIGCLIRGQDICAEIEEFWDIQRTFSLIFGQFWIPQVCMKKQDHIIIGGVLIVAMF